MDAHFVPNLTFGPKTIKALRPRTTLPFDAHLMVAEPGRYIDEYIDAGCDSITFHVEIEEPIAPTLEAIRAAGTSGRPGDQARDAGQRARAVRGAPRHRPDHDRRARLRRATFMEDVLAAKASGRARSCSHKLYGGEIHVDGGINRETAEFAGSHGVDVFVVGSALFVKGRDMGREVRLIRALADEGFQYGPNDGKPPIPSDRMTRFTSLPKHLAHRLMDEIEATGHPGDDAARGRAR